MFLIRRTTFNDFLYNNQSKDLYLGLIFIHISPFVTLLRRSYSTRIIVITIAIVAHTTTLHLPLAQDQKKGAKEHFNSL